MQCANVPEDTIYLPDAREAQADSRGCDVVSPAQRFEDSQAEHRTEYEVCNVVHRLIVLRPAREKRKCSCLLMLSDTPNQKSATIRTTIRTSIQRKSNRAVSASVLMVPTTKALPVSVVIFPAILYCVFVLFYCYPNLFSSLIRSFQDRVELAERCR